MADPTDRQRAEAKAREILDAQFAPRPKPTVEELEAILRCQDVPPVTINSDGSISANGQSRLFALIADALLSARREGWEAGREAAAKWHDKNAAACRKFVAEGIEDEANESMAQEHESAAEHLRALPTPKEK